MTYDLYFLLLAVVWLTIWVAVYWGLRQREITGSLLGPNRRKRTLILGAICTAVLFGYLMSYVPFLYCGLNELRDLYVPAEWAIDHTWLRVPLVWWATIWNVDHRVVMDSAARLKHGVVWGTIPPWLYAIGWLALGSILSVAPPYLLRVMQKKLRKPSLDFCQWCRRRLGSFSSTN